MERLSLYSIERRREIYIIIYVWKMVEGMVLMIRGLGGDELQVTHSARRGRLIRIPALRRVVPRLSTKLETSFMTLGPRLFNCLSRELRKENLTLNTFKRKLDLTLSQIPDRPVLPHYHQVSRSNSLIGQVGHAIQLNGYIPAIHCSQARLHHGVAGCLWESTKAMSLTRPLLRGASYDYRTTTGVGTRGIVRAFVQFRVCTNVRVCMHESVLANAAACKWVCVCVSVRAGECECVRVCAHANVCAAY